MAKTTSNIKLKKYARVLERQGRFGDTELVHINKDEERLLEDYRGGPLTRNPKTGVKEAFPWLAAAAVVSGVSSYIGASKQKKAAEKAARQQRKALNKAYNQAKRQSPEEIRYQTRMREQSKTGTMNVGNLTQDVSRRSWEQSRTAQAGVSGQMAMRGLENSIVAQELRRKTDVQTMRTVADQARKIAMANEQTKLQSQSALDKYNLQRSQYLRELATSREQGIGEINAAQTQNVAAATAAQWNALGSTVSGVMSGIGQNIAATQGAFSSIKDPNTFMSQFGGDQTALSAFAGNMDSAQRVQFYNWGMANAPNEFANFQFN